MYKTILFRIPAIFILLTGLPLAGILLTGKNVSKYLEFPPQSYFISHASFSWPLFLVFLLCEIAAVAFICILLLEKSQKLKHRRPKSSRQHAFPRWGIIGLLIVAVSWWLSWTRYEWFADYQKYTYIPLWFGFIILVNALIKRRLGSCPLTGSPAKYLMLFPCSSLFWWYFEYLNRFTQNWEYAGTEVFGPLGYGIYATICFSTVLPAIAAICKLLWSYNLFNSNLIVGQRISILHPRFYAIIALLLSCTGLFLLGIFPNWLFPLLWIAPLLVLSAWLVLEGRTLIFGTVREGDWRTIITPALSALICGFFWEMWNFFSIPKWQYSIPFVDMFQVFEMPLLGFGGYMPFGLECILIVYFVDKNKLLFPEMPTEHFDN